VVERGSLKVAEAPSPNRSGLDRPGESAGDQTADELATVLAADGTREGAVWRSRKHPAWTMTVTRNCRRWVKPKPARAFTRLSLTLSKVALCGIRASEELLRKPVFERLAA
jgi:hypothetical protein